MKRFLPSAAGCAIFFIAAKIAFTQSPEKTESDANRVTVSMNADGSHTVYQFDDARHKAIATTTSQDGKVREKIHYDMDDLGRFSSGTIFGPDGRLRFKSRYKYDSAAVSRMKPRARKTGPSCIRSFTATIKTGSKPAIPSLTQTAN